MLLTEISVIIPMSDMEQEIAGLIRSAAGQVSNLTVEFLIVDMGSRDRSILQALTVMKELKLRGCVVQNGSGTIGSAFNTGICKATGDYLTFLFPRRLYRDFIAEYYETAKASGADLIYGTPSGEKTQTGLCAGADTAMRLMQGKASLDIGAILLRRAFLLEQQVRFSEECTYGFSEEFILRALLHTGKVSQSPARMQRDLIFELPQEKDARVGIRCFERVEAMRRIYDVMKARHAKDDKLRACFLQQKMPDSVLSCVDLLLHEGLGYNATRGAVRLKRYDRYLIPGKTTSVSLRRQLLTWRMIPWMYHSRLGIKK